MYIYIYIYIYKHTYTHTFWAMSLPPERTTARSIPCASIFTISTCLGTRARRFASDMVHTERRSRTYVNTGGATKQYISSGTEP